MLSLKKICLEAIVRASKAGNTAVLGPQLFLPEIYPHYLRQIEINSGKGSIRSYVTSEKDFYDLWKIYMKTLQYCDEFHEDDSVCAGDLEYALEDIKKYERYNMRRFGHLILHEYNIPIMLELDIELSNIIPVTNITYDLYKLDKLHIKDAACVPIGCKVYYHGVVPNNLLIFVNSLPPAYINIGLLFGKLHGPIYVKYEHIELTRNIIDGLAREM
jgi:hypothetical protein